MPRKIYLDHAAATPMDKEVLAAMLPYFVDKFYNPSATYLAAEVVRKDIEVARKQVARLIGAKPAEIIFTAGGSEANNLAILGITKQFPDSNVVVSAIEHESVLSPADTANAKLAPVTSEGLVNVPMLLELVDDRTVLVSVMYANNEIGTIQPLADIARELEVIRRRRQQQDNDLPLYFHTDAAQAGNYLDLHVSRLSVDLMTLNGGKVYGPKASGALYAAAHVRLQPLIYGGGQERSLRSGTENVPAIVGLAVALECAQARRHDETKRLQALQRLFFDRLNELLPNAIINGSTKRRLPNNVHVTLPGQDNERLLFGLDETGIQAAAGSACSASNDEPSHVLRACGITDVAAQASLRFTLGRGTTADDIERTVTELGRLVA